MTSPDAPSSILRDLSFADDDGARASTAPFRFEFDFDGRLPFPDLPFDPAAPASRYDEAARPAIRSIVDAAAEALGERAPKARTFVDGAVDRLMLRRSSAVGGATSSSNRLCVGTCVLTNADQSPDPMLICAEALVHEGTHQYLYRVEQAGGPFCDLDATRRYRSPWSGNRIPLHSLVHASFVYYGLLGMWGAFAGRTSHAAASEFARDRIARSLFGYTFIGKLIEGPSFPRAAVRADILDAIVEIARRADALQLAPTADRPFVEMLARVGRDGWLVDLRGALAEAA